MQKLVKRKMHYETIMPVEAYHPEDDTWEDEINAGLLLLGGISIFLPPPFNGIGSAITLLGGAGNMAAHHEPTVEFVTEAVQAYDEAEIQNIRDEAAHSEMILEGGGSVVGAFVDALDDHGGGETSPPHPGDMQAISGRVLH